MGLGRAAMMVMAAVGSLPDFLGGRGTPSRARKSKHRKNRLAEKRAFAEAQSERHLEVACCHKCRAWFPTTAERNAHRAEKHAQKAA